MTVRNRRCLALLLCWTPLLAADADAPAKRPKIGLVLGGGGARGLAHIGVVEWLEENRIPVDLIAGTSMGGIVGGLYAMGMTPSDLKDLIRRIDWDEALRGTPSYTDSSLRRKQDRRDYPGLQFGWNRGLRLGQGLNSGHFVSMILDRISLPYWRVTDFDQLPIQFRCVTADLISAKAVVLSEGPIAEALRATMAIPGIFTPIQRGNQLLVDGGVLNNVPVDVAKAMGADVIIAVNVGSPLRTRQDLQSLIAILDQTTSLAAADNTRMNLQLADIIITPALEEFTLGSFTRGEALAREGYNAAAATESRLRTLALSDVEWQRYRNELTARFRKDVPVPKSLILRGPTDEAASAIRERLEPHNGAALNPRTLERDLTRMLGWGRYSALTYELQEAKNPSENPQLLVRAEPLVNGPAVIRVGLNIEGAHTQQVEVNLRARTTAFDIGGYGSETRFDMSFGTTLCVATEYYRPIGKSKFFVAPRAYAGRTTANVTPSKDSLLNYRLSTAGAGIDLGYGVLSRTDEVRLGYEIRHIDTSIVIGNPQLPPFSGASNAFSLRWFHDGQDSATFPRRGLELATRGSWYLNSAVSGRDYPEAEFTASFFHPVSQNGSIFIAPAAGTMFNRRAPLGLEFAVGGPLRLSSYGAFELRGSDYALAGAGYLHQLSAGTFMKLYGIGLVQVGRVFRGTSADRSGLDVTAGIGVDTLIGPVVFGMSVGDAGHRKAFISIGRVF